MAEQATIDNALWMARTGAPLSVIENQLGPSDSWEATPEQLVEIQEAIEQADGVGIILPTPEIMVRDAVQEDFSGLPVAVDQLFVRVAFMLPMPGQKLQMLVYRRRKKKGRGRDKRGAGFVFPVPGRHFGGDDMGRETQWNLAEEIGPIPLGVWWARNGNHLSRAGRKLRSEETTSQRRNRVPRYNDEVTMHLRFRVLLEINGQRIYGPESRTVHVEPEPFPYYRRSNFPSREARTISLRVRSDVWSRSL